MIRKSFAITAICLLALGACNSNNNPEDPGAFRFSAIRTSYKGTGTMVAAGDSAGIFAGAPLSVSNRRGIMESSGYLTFSPSLQVVEGSSDSCRICAYLPYAPALDGSQPIFYAKTDQIDSSGFLASNLCTASGYVIAGDNGKATKLTFNPVMTLLSLQVTNMTDSPVTSVRAKKLRRGALINTDNGSVTAVGENADFTCYADPDSAGIYKLYLPPQEASFIVSATLENGDEYDFSMTAAMTSGKYCTNYSSPFVIEAKIGPVKPEDFTKITIPGVFHYTSEILTPILTYTAGADQYVVSSSAASRNFRLQNPKDGWMYRTSTSPATLAEGSGVTIQTEAVNCTAALSSGSYAATVVRVSESTAWLSCPTAELGFIIKID